MQYEIKCINPNTDKEIIVVGEAHEDFCPTTQTDVQLGIEPTQALDFDGNEVRFVDFTLRQIVDNYAIGDWSPA